MWRFCIGFLWILIQASNCVRDVSDVSFNNTSKASSVNIQKRSHLRNCCSPSLKEQPSVTRSHLVLVPKEKLYTSAQVNRNKAGFTIGEEDLREDEDNRVRSTRSSSIVDRDLAYLKDVITQTTPFLSPSVFTDEPERYLKSRSDPFKSTSTWLKRVARSDSRENLPFFSSVLSSLNNSLLMEELENIMPLASPKKKERALNAFHRAREEKSDNPSIEDIISDIIHLLGGNVKPSQPSTRPLHSRINDRGPPKFDFQEAPSGLASTNNVFPNAQDVSQILGLLTTEPSSLSPSFASTIEITSTPVASPSTSSSIYISTSFMTSFTDSIFVTKTADVISSSLVSSTDWLPLKELPNGTTRSNSITEEPVIITAPITPSTFELTVTNVIGTQITPQNTTWSTKTRSKPTTDTNIVWGKVSDVTQHPAIQADVGNKHHLIDPRPPARRNSTADVIPIDIDKVRPLGKPSRGSSHTHLRPETQQNGDNLKPIKPPERPSRKPYSPTQIPKVRIDTCIVGDDTTCNVEKNERCVTEYGVSSCYCKPGYGRTLQRGPCLPVLKLLFSFNVDRFGDRKLHYTSSYSKTETEEYKIMEHEANRAVSTLFAYTTFAGVFAGASVNNLYNSEGKIAVNATMQLDDLSLTHSRVSLAVQLQRELGNAIINRRNRVGDSKLYAERPLTTSSLLNIQDINECIRPELNDCSPHGTCYNSFGTFGCICLSGYTDKYPDDERMSGRVCTACSPDYCNKHGECIINDGKRECRCHGNYIGSRCETDGEVLGVALGVSLAAVIVIILTVICLCLWSRRWKREQKNANQKATRNCAAI
ncbi:uncharacterized protein [Centruroides vittatus]|uniref:uncharacterized protein n=1 Tax=Centruroides vittatus TaxID=120091 RepID=UPI00350ED9D9